MFDCRTVHHGPAKFIHNINCDTLSWVTWLYRTDQAGSGVSFQDSHWPQIIRHPLLHAFSSAWGHLKILTCGRKNWLSPYPMFFQICCLWCKMCFLGSFRIVVSVTQVAFYVNYSFFSGLERLILTQKLSWHPGSVVLSQRERITQQRTLWCCSCCLVPGGATQGTSRVSGVGNPGARPSAQPWLHFYHIHLTAHIVDEIVCVFSAPGPEPSLRPPLLVIHPASTL